MLWNDSVAPLSPEKTHTHKKQIKKECMPFLYVNINEMLPNCKFTFVKHSVKFELRSKIFVPLSSSQQIPNFRTLWMQTETIQKTRIWYLCTGTSNSYLEGNLSLTPLYYLFDDNVLLIQLFSHFFITFTSKYRP